jgi:hypothetical protein
MDIVLLQAITACAQGLMLCPKHSQLMMAQAESYASVDGE